MQENYDEAVKILDEAIKIAEIKYVKITTIFL